MLHEAIFLAICNATNVATCNAILSEWANQSSSFARCRRLNASAILFVIVRVASCEKVANVRHPPCNLKGFLFVIVALQVARKVASCNMALRTESNLNTWKTCSILHGLNTAEPSFETTSRKQLVFQNSKRLWVKSLCLEPLVSNRDHFKN